MIQFIVGEKGEGKTKVLLELANQRVESSDGMLVYIDKDTSSMYNLATAIRLVETQWYPLSNYGEFIGFIYGILSQNNDITDIYIDGLGKIIKRIDNETLVKLVKKLETISGSHRVDFTVGLSSSSADDLPSEVKELIKK